MTKLNQQLLFMAGPTIFKNSQVRTWGIDCSDGWMSILLDLVIKLEKRSSLRPEAERICVVQIKEKFGTLRFYIEGPASKLDDFDIGEAESRSAIICEDCGAAGKSWSDGWQRTLCEPCIVALKEKRRHEARN